MITKEVKDKWLRLLRSSRYKDRKIKKALVEEKDGKLCYCAIGLLERAYGNKIVKNKLPGAGPVFYRVAFNKALTPYQIGKIVDMNDCKGWSFREIADWVEENIRALSERSDGQY